MARLEVTFVLPLLVCIFPLRTCIIGSSNERFHHAGWWAPQNLFLTNSPIQHLGTQRPSKGPELSCHLAWLPGYSWGLPGVPAHGQEAHLQGTSCAAWGFGVGQAAERLVSVLPPSQVPEYLSWPRPSLLKSESTSLTSCLRKKL